MRTYIIKDGVRVYENEEPKPKPKPLDFSGLNEVRQTKPLDFRGLNEIRQREAVILKRFEKSKKIVYEAPWMKDVEKPVNSVFSGPEEKARFDAFCDKHIPKPTTNTKEWKKLYGGKCIKCGYSKSLSALEFHHVIPAMKEHTPAKLTASVAPTGNPAKVNKVKLELNKCALLCSNCHSETHYGTD